MTTASISLRARVPRVRARPLAAAGRLLRLELRRNPMVWLLLPLGALMGFSPYQVSMEYAPVWNLRASVMLDHFLPLVAFGAGAAAWMGSREARRRTTDMVTTTPRPGWARKLATCAATTCWMLVAYACLVALLYGVTARQATWGGPVWWPVAVGGASLAVSCALGFAAGMFIPSRFTVPLAALAVGMAALMGVSHSTNPYALLSGADGIPPSDIGVFYRNPPDLAVIQLMFLIGLGIAAAGALGLPASSGGPWLRRSAAAVTVVGLAAAGTAVGLTGTASVRPTGVVIPALHDAAGDGPIGYTPACSGVVCIHPAFRAYLADLVTAFDPVLSEVAGLPGAPARADQIASSDAGDVGALISGSPAVFRFALPATSHSFIGDLDTTLVTLFIGGQPAAKGNGGTPAQQAVESGLLTAAGVQGADSAALSQASPAISHAAARFAALSRVARRTWLATYLPALRAGHITLVEVP
ncbi:MAG: hypothetical protein JO345_14410 [Streptosporangiaceae bacterium]|nr:hypothetical protein [Streptosporangiaceae bacterium]